ncbi:MAG TPA: autotransporter domain-containing protein [Sedimentisphaerales bacterium]|nr:autotransporter domain-containing protein [Sedimentisphaerales bacterium]
MPQKSNALAVGWPTPPPSSLVPGTVCANPDEYLFWDQFHPTSAAHQILAEYAADTLLAPETIGAQANLALTNGDSFLRRMQEAILGTGGSIRGQSMPSGSKSLSEQMPDRGHVFVNVRGVDVDGSPTTNAFGFDSQVTQVSGGVVVRPWDNVKLGLIGGIDDGTADLDQYSSSVDLTSYHLGLAAGYDNGALFAGGGVSFSQENYDLYRQTFVPQLQSAADTSGNPFGAFGSAGYRFNLGRITAGPLFALRYTEVEIDQYRETGAPGLDMIVQSQRAEQLIGSAGIAAAIEFTMLSTTVVPYIHLALEGDLLGDDRIIRTALVTVPDVGRRHLIESEDDVYGRLDGGISFAVAPGLTGTLSGETTISRDAGDEQAIMGTISGRF